MLVLLVCATQVPRLEFNGDLRSMSLVPTELASAEEHLRTTWGDFRGLAMLWSPGENSQQRLESNYRLFELLQRREAGTPPVSLAPLVPPRRVQEENLARWRRFWTSTEGESIRARLQEEAQRLGFSAGAFAPFFAGLESTPPPHDLAGLQAAGLGDLSRSLVGEDGALLTLVADDPDLPALIDESFAGEVIAVSPGGFRRELSAAIDQDFRRFILSALAAVTLLLVILFRRPRPVIAAAVPVLSGMLVMFGLMALFGLSFNLFNVIASILVIGLGIDYGIFMVCRLRDGLDRATDRAVLVSGLTTLAGFGALALAQHPALHSIGVTVLLGIGAALPAALLVIPALYREESACDA